MDFWNMAVPGLTFLAPLAAILFFTLKRPGHTDVQYKSGLALFGLMLLVSAIGVVRFQQPVKSEFLWALTIEPSGYFEFSLQMFWLRYVWIFFTAALFLAFILLESRTSLDGPRGLLRFHFLIAAYLFSSLAYLSENVFLSFMFIEIAAFLLHSFGVEMGGAEGRLEKESYFKRSCFIFLSLVTMFGLAATHLFSTNSIILMGVILYIISIALSKHNFVHWRYLPLAMVQIGAALFLLGQVTQEEFSAELWIPLAALFACAATIFSACSLLARESLNSAFWMVLTFLSYFLFLRFSSNKPTDQFWGTFEAIGMGAAFAISYMFRFGSLFDLLWKRIVGFVMLLSLLAIISGALPGLEAAALKFDAETALLKMLGLGAVTFLVAIVAAKALFQSFHEPRETLEAGPPSSFLWAVGAVVIVLAVEIGVIFQMNGFTSESNMASGFPSFYDPRTIIVGSALFLGLFAGSLLGNNARFISWIKTREMRMENLFPVIDPAVVSWNQSLIQAPERWLDIISEKITRLASISTIKLEHLDRQVFGDRFLRGLGKYGSSFSLMVRYFHSGSVRVYMFIGALVTLVSSLIFLLEGR